MDFSSPNYYPEFRGDNHQEAYKKNEYDCTCTSRKGPRVRPKSRAYSDADPGLVRPTAAAAAIVAVVAAATSAAAADDDFGF